VTGAAGQLDHFHRFLRDRHHLQPDQVVPTDSPGYWRLLVPCGRPEHRCCEGWATAGAREPYFHTVTYLDEEQRDPATGRFLSPYRTWTAARAALGVYGAVRARAGATVDGAPGRAPLGAHRTGGPA
jgi:hypothetical protein